MGSNSACLEELIGKNASLWESLHSASDICIYDAIDCNAVQGIQIDDVCGMILRGMQMYSYRSSGVPKKKSLRLPVM